MNISGNFTLSEAVKSNTALRLGIDNGPPESMMPALIGVATNILEPVRGNFGLAFQPNSWHRCEALEKAICWGGDNEKSSFARWCGRRSLPVDEASWALYFDKKQHPKGNAVDFELPGIPNIDLARWCRDNLKFDQLILEFYDPANPAGGWVHGSWLAEDNRGQVLTIGKTGTFTGLPD